MAYLKLLRPKTMLLGGLLILASFSTNNLSVNWLVFAWVTIISGGVYSLNDVFNFEHDLKKGKTFVRDHKKGATLFNVLIWSAITFLGVLIIIEYGAYFMPMFFMWIVGIMYSFLRKMPLISNMSVALWGSAITYIPNQQINIFSLVTFIFLLNREILNDYEDSKVDLGYKWTLPTKLPVLNLYVIMVFLGCMLIFYTSSVNKGPWVIEGLKVLLFTGALAMYFKKYYKNSKLLYDLGFLVYLFSLIF